MELNKLYEALEKKAINKERSKIQSAINNLKSALREPNGSTFQYCQVKMNVVIGNEDVEVNVDSDNFFVALKSHLLSTRKELLIHNQIQEFMSSQERYANQINSMQEYLEENS